MPSYHAHSFLMMYDTALMVASYGQYRDFILSDPKRKIPWSKALSKRKVGALSRPKDPPFLSATFQKLKLHFTRAVDAHTLAKFAELPISGKQSGRVAPRKREVKQVVY